MKDSIILFQKPFLSDMYKLGLILIILAFSDAKISPHDGTDNIEVLDSNSRPSKNLNVCISNSSKDTLWVLDFYDDAMNFKQLRSANKMDRRVYAEVIEPFIKNFQLHQIAKANDNKHPKVNSTATSEKDSNTEQITKYDMKKAVMMMINKFVLAHNGDPNFNLHPGDNNKVSLKLYFKGQYSSLVVRYKNKRWHYFLQPPSPLPSWFYEKHTKVIRSGPATYVKIPDSIQKEFYGKFFYLLGKFMSFVMM